MPTEREVIVVMSMHKLVAGDGYAYLTRQVADGDAGLEPGASLTAYYEATGNPPGRWCGAGLAALGIEPAHRVRAGDRVTEEAMAAVFRDGHDPVTGEPLGRGFRGEIPVVGFDLTFTAVFDAAQALTHHGLATPADVRSATNQRLDDVEHDWRAVRGQRSGISWRYLLLLDGRHDVKPDRMIIRFVASTIDRQPSAVEAASLVAAVSATGMVDADLRTLDHRIWSFQSGRG